MIKINKRPLPEGVAITKESDYRSGIVFQMLVEDFHEKCYICEDSVHTSPNVEHRISHKSDPILKYDWNNLYLSCGHCNNIKLGRYDDIIDPIHVDPEEFIELSYGGDAEVRSMVIIRKIKGCGDVDLTICLLNEVYNEPKPDMKKYACSMLKRELAAELAIFRQLLEEYQANPSEAAKMVIEEELSDKSLFAAFKRNMARNSPCMQP